MKKILAIAVIAIMTVALCVSASATGIQGRSFDTIYVNDLENPAVNNGAAGQWAEENPIDTEVTALRVRGWAYIDQAIKEFGYQIDEGEIVYSAGYTLDRPDVRSALHLADDATEANGFDISINVENVGKGLHSLKVYVKGADGEAASVCGFEFTQKLEGNGTVTPTQPSEPAQPSNQNPSTADASVIAIAAVAVVALAGVVVAKKVK